MPMLELTKTTTIANLPHPDKGQTYFWDTTLRGFGVVVGTKSKTYVVQRDVNGKTQRMKIGRVDEMPLTKARKKAETAMGKMAAGRNPVEEHRAARAEGMTLRDAWELYEGHLTAKERSQRTIDGYLECLERYLSDWLDRPIAEIDTKKAHERHVKIGKQNGRYAANATMRVLRAVWRRARRQYPALGEPPTVNVDFFREKPRTAILDVDRLPDWYAGVASLDNPIRRDLYLFLLFTGLRSEEARTLKWDQVDLQKKVVHFPKTKTDPFDLPLSDFLVDLLNARRKCEKTKATFNEPPAVDYVFPAHGKSGYIAQPKLSAREARDLPVPFFPHLLRHTFISIAENKIAMPMGHARLLVNHALPGSGDAHMGYVHPDLEDLRRSQQAMTDFLKAAIWPQEPAGNVVNIAEARRIEK